jgi:AbiV family abortive infection protein
MLTIKPERIPEGIQICVKNSDRHFADSRILFSTHSYQSATTSALLAAEECVKVMVLLKHYKQKSGTALSEEEFKKYFRSGGSVHDIRLSEFYRLFHESIAGTLGQKFRWPAHMAKFWGRFMQEYKNRMIYADWLDDRWHNPLHDEEDAIDSEQDIEQFVRLRYIFLAHDLQQVYDYLSKDADYNRAMAEPVPETLNNFRVIQLVNEKIPKIPIRTQVKRDAKKITVHIGDKEAVMTEHARKEIRNLLSQKYPDYEVIVRLSDAAIK